MLLIGVGIGIGRREGLVVEGREAGVSGRRALRGAAEGG